MKKYIYALLRRIAWFFVLISHFIMRIFPVRNNKIFISNYYGKGYGDNAKYICEELLKSDKNYDIVWLVNDLSYSLPKAVRKVKNNTLKSIYELCTAGVWIDNCRKPLYVRKRKNQYYIQTWHADIGFKKIEKEAINSLSPSYIKAAKNDSKMIDVVISGNEWFTDLINKSFWYSGEIAKYGSPRRDIFYSVTDDEINDIKRKINIDSNVKIVLYAPTFRKVQSEKDLGVYDIAWEKVLEALESRFGGKWMGLIRLHPNISKLSRSLNYPKNVIDVTSYPDMQELLLASDVCITDYSSSVLEFAITKKAGFIFATDYEEYIKDRELTFDLKLLPFPFSNNNEELVDSILSFDKDKYLSEHKKFYGETLGMYDDGEASKKVVSLIESI